jgi:hypothetical protein
MAIAHALIEADGVRYARGQDVPDDLPGIEELREYGSVSDAAYDPAVDEVPPPDEIVIEGVVYKRTHDAFDTAEASA